MNAYILFIDVATLASHLGMLLILFLMFRRMSDVSNRSTEAIATVKTDLAEADRRREPIVAEGVRVGADTNTKVREAIDAIGDRDPK